MVRRHARSGGGDLQPGWGSAAGYALEQADRVLGALGQPVGVWSYRPHHAVGEDFLHNYLGNIGIPLDLSPTFPSQADTVLLTEAAAHDPEIVTRIHGQLSAGKNVIITSGLLCALDGRGIERIVELDCTGRDVAIRDFINGYGAGSGASLNDPAHANPAILFPEIRFHTNDSWPIIRGVAGARGFPIVLMNRYSRGILYVLNIPENISDLYALPRPLLTQIKTYLFGDFPVRIDSDPLVSLFVYDNDTIVVHSFRDEPSNVIVSVSGANARLRTIASNEAVALAAFAVAAECPRPAGAAAHGICNDDRATFVSGVSNRAVGTPMLPLYGEAVSARSAMTEGGTRCSEKFAFPSIRPRASRAATFPTGGRIREPSRAAPLRRRCCSDGRGDKMRAWLSIACTAVTGLFCAAFAADPLRLDYVFLARAGKRRAACDSDGCQLSGRPRCAAIGQPERDDDAPVSFRARNFPRAWSFASDLQHPGLRLGDLRSSVSVGGDYRRCSRRRGRSFWFANPMRGSSGHSRADAWRRAKRPWRPCFARFMKKRRSGLKSSVMSARTFSRIATTLCCIFAR